MISSDLGKVDFLLHNIQIRQPALWLVHPYERVGGDNLSFQIGQRTDAEIIGFAINPLIYYERDKEPHLSDLNGDGLDVHAVDAVFDEVEFASVIEFVRSKASFILAIC